MQIFRLCKSLNFFEDPCFYMMSDNFPLLGALLSPPGPPFGASGTPELGAGRPFPAPLPRLNHRNFP